ncbi:hypothetical protein DCS_03483 [Drechmeria coniospora]|uniref:DUF924 domain protein n=1 Tax=Drechmeria coniospora TaxID=98403 RepID=A0A151GH87_DRECN|nr:hypothetical protein DCS_03483 [Drechmeria coniospora]KYK56483.1 hypothetical protein DCS_03483 [Drechmeria coniospora]
MSKANDLRSALTPALLAEVRDFWFEHLAGPDSLVIPVREDSMRWFAGGEELDRLCVQRFQPTLEAIRRCAPTSGDDIIAAVDPLDPRDWMSLLVLLDQMPRNCYRGPLSATAFTFFDPLARDLAMAAMKRGIPDGAPVIRWQLAYRSWFYMPLMHSEELAAHETAVAAFGKMIDDVRALSSEKEGPKDEDEFRAKARTVVQSNVEQAIKVASMNADFEKKHYDIIKRFGRYPHRNPVLGREPTAEEVDYLANGGETFG